MDHNIIDLTVIQVTSPGNFIAKEVANVSPKNVSEFSSFLDFAGQMNRYYEHEEQSLLQESPIIGEVYAGKRQSDKGWYRVRIIDIFIAPGRQTAQCKLIDYGSVELISTSLIRTLPKYFSNFPFQVQTYRLSGIQPLTLGFDKNLIAVERPSERWDSAAVEYFKKLIEESENIQAEIVSRDSSGVNFVRLFLRNHTEVLCVNDHLCLLKYATKQNDSVPQKIIVSTGHMNRTVDEYLKQKKLKQSDSDKDNYTALNTSGVRREIPGFMSGYDSDASVRLKTLPAGDLNKLNLKKELKINPTVASCLSNEGQQMGGEGGEVDSTAIPLSEHLLYENPTLPTEKGYQSETIKDVLNRSSLETLQISNIFQNNKYPVSPKQMGRGEILAAAAMTERSSGLVKRKDHLHSACQFSKSDNTKSEREISNTSYKDMNKSQFTERQEFLGRMPTSQDNINIHSKPEGDGIMSINKNSPEAAEMVSCLGRGQRFQSSHSGQIPNQTGAGLSGWGIRSSSQSDLRPLDKNTGRVQNFNPSKLISNSNCAEKLTVCPTKSLGRGQRLIHLIQSSQVNTNVKEQQKFEDAEKHFKDSSNETQDISDNNIEESVNSLLNVITQGFFNASEKRNKGSGDKTNMTFNLSQCCVKSKNAENPSKPTEPTRSSVINKIPTALLDRNKSVESHTSLLGNKMLETESVTSLEAGTITVTQKTTCMQPVSEKTISFTHVTEKQRLEASPVKEKDISFATEDLKSSPELQSVIKGRRPNFAEDKQTKPVENKLSNTDSNFTCSVLSDGFMSTHIPDNFLQMKGETEGQKLLEMICPKQMAARPTGLPQLHRADRPTPKPFRGVVVHGISQPMPLDDCQKLPFQEEIEKVYGDAPSAVQCYTWAAILRGRSIVGISPPRSGKTVAFLRAIFHLLYSPGAYIGVPPGNGPLALILVPTWKKAEFVYDLCNTVFVQGRKNMNIICLYAGGREAENEISLINGCEVLIATPPCLLRMIEMKSTNLNRLCHLVLDEADILTEEFTSEIQSVMSIFGESRKHKKSQSLTTQLVLFGSQWTLGIESFIKSFMSEPLIVVTSLFEAAVYGKVKQVVHLCLSIQHLATVSSVIKEIGKPGEKIIICTSQNDDVACIEQALSTAGVLCLTVDSESKSHVLEKTVQQWTTLDCLESYIVLVTNDDCLMDLAIVDATAVVHFDLPATKIKFGVRLGSMSNYFRDLTSAENSPRLVTSHIIVAEDEDCKKIKSLMKFLKRSQCKIPSQLGALVSGIQAGQDEDKNRKLCVYLKAFGTCINKENECKDRHVVIPGEDAVTDLSNIKLPSSGEVKVRLNHIEDASHFYMRLLEHRHPDGKITDFTGIYLELLMAMAQYFHVGKNCQHPTDIKRGMLYALRDQHKSYHRVKILDLETKDDGPNDKAKVFFVDDGKKDEICIKDLWNLPDELAAYPYQAVEVFLAHIRPMDKDTEWTPNVSRFIIDQLSVITSQKSDDEWRLDGQIVLSLGNTMWLDPLVKRSLLQSVNVVTNKFNVRKELIKNKLAVDNPEHITNLYELCKDLVDQPLEHLYEKNPDEMIEREVLPDDVEFHDVIVSAVESPDLFFIQRLEKMDQLQDMLDDINKKMTTSALKIPLDTLTTGSLCLAVFSEDIRWYRGKVMSVTDEGFEVFFFDYGDKELVDKCKVKPLPQEYTQLPCQAIQCRLHGLKPKGEVWDDQAGSALLDMALFLSSEKRFLVVKVISLNSQTYTVSLYDTTSVEDLNLAQELVWKGYASRDQGGDLTDLFKISLVPSLENYSNNLQKIEDLCSLVYWSHFTDSDLAVSKSDAVQCIITESLQSSDFTESLLESRAHVYMCMMIRYLTNVQAHEKILHSITQAMLHSESVCQAFLGEGICLSLLRCIEQTLIPEIQQQACQAMCELLVSVKFRSALCELNPFLTLTDYLNTISETQIQCSVYKLVTVLLYDSERISSKLKLSGLCKKSADSLSKTNNHQLTENILQFFAQLASLDSCHSEIKRDAVMEAVITKMSSSVCNECIYQCASFCEYLSNASRKNKTLLLEHKVVVVLNSLLNQPLGSKTRELCQTLQTSLAIPVPEQQVITGQYYRGDDSDRSALVVTWVQNTFKILLTVKVSGAEKDNFEVKENSVHFRRYSDGVTQKFDYELFGEIIPEKTEISVHSNEAVLSLRKLEKGKWSRLMKDKQKNTSVLLDFEKMNVSSDNELSDEETPFVLWTKKSKLPRSDTPVRKDHLQYPVSSDDSDSENPLTPSEEDGYGEDPLDLFTL